MFEMRLFPCVLTAVIAFMFVPATGAPVSHLGPNINDPSYIAEVAGAKRSVFMARCGDEEARNILWITVGSSKVKYIEYIVSNGIVTNGGEFELKPHAIDRMDLMGGIGTQAIQRRIIRGLMKSPFQLVSPSRIRAAVLGTPRRKCDIP